MKSHSFWHGEMYLAYLGTGEDIGRTRLTKVRLCVGIGGWVRIRLTNKLKTVHGNVPSNREIESRAGSRPPRMFAYASGTRELTDIVNWVLAIRTHKVVRVFSVTKTGEGGSTRFFYFLCRGRDVNKYRLRSRFLQKSALIR